MAKVRIVKSPQIKESSSPMPARQGGYSNQDESYGLNLGYRQFDPTMSYKNPFSTTSNTLQPVPKGTGDIEAEKNEVIVGDFDNDGSIESMNVGGNRHSQGGTELNVPSNSFVFSDTKDMKIKDPQVLKMFGGASSAQTPADIAKKYNINKFKAIAEDPKSDYLQKETAQMMIDNYTNKLQQLAVVQEQKKGFPTGIPEIESFDKNGSVQMKYGGQLSKVRISKMQEGGSSSFRFDEENPNNSFQWNWGVKDGLPMPQKENVVGASRTQQDNSSSGIPMSQVPTYPVPALPEMKYDTSENQSKDSGITNYQYPLSQGMRGQDKLATTLAAYQLANIKKYPGYIAPVKLQTPQTTFLSPERELAANSEQANTQSMISALTSDGARQRGINSQIQGQALTNAGNILGRTQNANVEIANRAHQIAVDTANKQAEYNANRATELYKQGVISQQQYDNSIRQGQTNLLRTYEVAKDNQLKLAMVNRINYPNGYTVDPQTNKIVFSPTADFNSNLGSSSNPDYIAQRKAYYKSQGATEEKALEYAHHDATTEKMRTRYNPYQPMKTQYTQSSDPYLSQGQGNDYGAGYSYPGMGY